MSQSAIPTRAEIAQELTWDTASLFASTEEWEQAIDALLSRLDGVDVHRGHLGDGAEQLASWLNYAQELMRDAMLIMMYAYLEYSVDTTDQDAAARSDRARGVVGQGQAAFSFAEPEIIAIGFETLHDWVKDDPDVAAYAHYLERLEQRVPHVRSSEVEEVMGQLFDAFATASTTHQVLTNADLTFEPARGVDESDVREIGQGTVSTLEADADREIRRSAWENYADAHLAFKNSMANCMTAGVKQDVFRARVRRYDSSLDASLAPENIPPAVFHNLVETFRRHLPTWHRYWRLRKRALGVDSLREYDIKAPLTKAEVKIPYSQSVDWIVRGMAPLGEEYVDIMRRGATDDRWVDIYPNKGKSAGAFSWGAPGTHPFIMMSYTDDIYSLSTLAHELGHSMHSYLTWQSQPLVYAEYSMFAAEVASNFNQALVREYLFETESDRNLQINLIEEAMANFHRYFFIMPTLARFELEIHERAERGESLSADGLIELMADLFGEGYGDDLEMDRQRTGITWAQFSTHLYSNFYVYQYATGISAAHALADRVLAAEDGAVEQYLGFLRAGGSLYPLDALRQAGVDMTSPEPVEKAFAVMAGMIDRLETLLT